VIRIPESLTIIFFSLFKRSIWLEIDFTAIFLSSKLSNGVLNISFLALLDFANFKTLYGNEFWVD